MRPVASVVYCCCSPKLSLGCLVVGPKRIQYHVPDKAPAGGCLVIDVDILIELVIPADRGPVEPLSAAAALLALVLGLVAVDYSIHPRSMLHPGGKARYVLVC